MQYLSQRLASRPESKRDGEPPRGALAARQRERLLDATERLVAERGCAGTSIEAIVKAAGVSTVTFYEQFEGKEECFVAAFERAVEETVAEVGALNPETAEVEVDGSASDPIPHILKGIPLKVRDIRVYADKPNFTLNPTNCEAEATKATLWGGGANVFNAADDMPFGLEARFQAANCARLGFKPKLRIKLKGGTKRGGHPSLKAIVTPRPEDANFANAVVTLPHSAFLDQAHIRTICTRVQFNQGAGAGAACPAGSVYGKAKAWSPLLDEALQGPVFLRSSSHNLPDLVIALHGLVDINLDARIDSIKGGIRSTFEGIPDAPVSRFILEMQGAKKGLIVNSTDICQGKHLAEAKLSGQNGRLDGFKPAVSPAGCGKGQHKKGSADTGRHR